MDFIPNTEQDREAMLKAIGVATVDELLEVVPAQVRRPPIDLPAPLTEMELVAELRAIAGQNANLEDYRCFQGAGAYHHYVPAPISQLLLRSEFYTSYTPYQPEVSQGILQSMFEFQSMICALTGMDVTNTSMYDGATALAEAALMSIATTRRNKVVLSGAIHPECRAVVCTYLQSRGFQVVTSSIHREGDRIVEAGLEDLVDGETACCAVQQPDFFGRVQDLGSIAEKVHQAGGLFIVSSDPISLGMLKSPGEWGADIAVGEGQSLGNPISFGGPALGILACKERFVRHMPGRLVGSALDGQGRRGFVLTLQAREQHIRREKATSNICTSESLVALAAAIYLGLLGPNGLKQVANLCFEKAHYASRQIAALNGYKLVNGGSFFNEFVVDCPRPPIEINRFLLSKKIIGGYDLGASYPELQGCMLLCATEVNRKQDIDCLVSALAETGTTKGGAQ